MRLKQALIEGGVAFGNPEMEYPVRGTPVMIKNQYDYEGANKLSKYESDLKQWREGMLPFEDQDKVKEVLRVDKIMDAFENGKLQKLIDGKFDKHKDGLYSVDLDVTVVEQTRRKDLVPCAIWQDGTTLVKLPNYEYRKVLRIN